MCRRYCLRRGPLGCDRRHCTLSPYSDLAHCLGVRCPNALVTAVRAQRLNSEPHRSTVYELSNPVLSRPARRKVQSSSAAMLSCHTRISAGNQRVSFWPRRRPKESCRKTKAVGGDMRKARSEPHALVAIDMQDFACHEARRFEVEDCADDVGNLTHMADQGRAAHTSPANALAT